jgi:anti-sigma B factor antagonist
MVGLETEAVSLEITQRKKGAAVVLDVAGRLTAGAGANQLKDAVRELAEGGERRVLLNLRDVEFMDSTGLGSLAAVAEMMRTHGGQLRIVNAHGPVKHVFQITRLNKVFPDFPSEDAALASFAA